MRPDWTDLRVVLYACETGSMTEAADRAHLTLAAVSARIRALEEDAGVTLLRRHARGVVATAAGEALARHARVVFHQLNALRRDVLQPAAPHSRQTVLAVNSSALARPLHRVVGDVLVRHAGARLVARESSSEATVHALQIGAADVGIVTDAAHTDGLVTAELGADPLVLIASPAHPLATRGCVAFRDTLEHDWIAWGEAGALHTHLMMQAYRAGGALNAVISTPSPSGVVELVARGLGVSILPQALLHRLRSAHQVVALKVDERWAQRKLLVCHGPQCDAPEALALYDALRAQWWTLEARPGGW